MAKASGFREKVGERVDKLHSSQLWRAIFRPGSIFRRGYADSPRNRAYVVMNSLLYHLHPVKVKRHGIKLSYTLCLGGLSFFLFILLTITGIYLMFFYRPSVEVVYGDMQRLQHSGVVRPLGAEHAPVGRSPHGDQRVPPHGARLLHRRLQAAP